MTALPAAAIDWKQIAADAWQAPSWRESSTVEALVYGLRRGVNELIKADTQRRLSALDRDQVKEVCRRLQNFKPEIATPWLSDELAALIAKYEELHGRD